MIAPVLLVRGALLAKGGLAAPEIPTNDVDG
jgi:hypothetical protein